MMPIFDALPTIDVLIYFAASSGLSQPESLSKAMRLWSIVQKLYSEDFRIEPSDQFNPAQWRSIYHPTGLPTHSIAQALEATGVDIGLWSREYGCRYPQAAEGLSVVLETDPFYVSDRTWRNDFASLAELGWLQTVGAGKQRKYQLVSVLPHFMTLDFAVEVSTEQLIPNELTLIADPFFGPIQGQQRFILDIENVMSSNLSGRLSTIVRQLKSLWQLDPVPPIRLTYQSARLYQEEYEIIAYPVCIQYCQRAPYLFAFGQTPGTIEAQQPNLMEWYDYRLDHILKLEAIDWSDVPKSWRPKSWSGLGVPPRFVDKTPQRVLNEVGQGLGFEIYRPLEKLLLRFDRYFYANYIEGTEREKLFTPITWEQAERLWKRDSLRDGKAERQVPTTVSLQQLFKTRIQQQQDIFCLSEHRVGDNNVVMRMRAWGPNVEVLLPWGFRERMREDLTKSQSFYQT